SPDGHVIDLTAGGLSDAFDYYNVDIPDLSSTGPASAQAPGAAAAPAARLHQRAALAPAAVPSCLGGDANKTVTFSPSITLAGHFSAKIDKFNALFASIPKGAALDMEFAATLKGAISVDSNGDLNCGIPVKPFFKTIVTDPVPISIYFNLTAEFAVSGS